MLAFKKHVRARKLKVSDTIVKLSWRKQITVSIKVTVFNIFRELGSTCETKIRMRASAWK